MRKRAGLVAKAGSERGNIVARDRGRRVALR